MLEALAPPPAAERMRWLGLLAAARVQVGDDHFRRAPMIVASEACFPDEWSPTNRGLTRMLRRLCSYADGEWRIDVVAAFEPVQEVNDEPNPDGVQTRWRGEASHIYVNEDGDLCVDVDPVLADLADALIEELVVVVTRLWLVDKGVSTPSSGEVLATCVALGFGVPLLQGTWIVQTGGDTEGHMTSWWQRRSASRRAQPGEIALLVAAWAKARGHDPRHLEETLGANQRAALRAAFESVDDARFNGSFVEPKPLQLKSIDVSDVDDGADDAKDKTAHAGPVFRVRQRRIAGPSLSGWTVGLLISGVWLARSHDSGGWLFAVPAVALGTLGTIAGFFVTIDECSDPSCKSEFEDDATTCPGCGGKISGRIKNRDERLAAEESLRKSR